MFDRTLEDNELLGDLAFTNEEITDGMARAARNFNSTPPYVGAWRADRMPLTTNLPLLMVSEELYKSQLHKLMRNETSYAAGGVTVDQDRKMIGNLQALVLALREDWKEMATRIKFSAHVQGYYGKL